jgi:fructose 1,6-bisphosphatase
MVEDLRTGAPSIHIHTVTVLLYFITQSVNSTACCVVFFVGRMCPSIQFQVVDSRFLLHKVQIHRSPEQMAQILALVKKLKKYPVVQILYDRSHSALSYWNNPDKLKNRVHPLG